MHRTHAAVYLQYNNSEELRELIAIVRPVHRGGRNTNSARFASLVDYWRCQDTACAKKEKANRSLKQSSSVTSKESKADGALHKLRIGFA